MSGGTRWRVGLDIGGTFTDFILYDSDQNSVLLHKQLTTPDDPSDAALAGLEELVAKGGIALAEVGEIVHGTTLVTNTLIERKGAKLGLITTEGFRDILEMGTEQRYDIYDLFLKFPEPLVQRRHRLGVPERVDRDGKIVVPLDRNAVRHALRSLVEEGIEAVAVCFLHSYRNSEHERLVGEIARAEFGQLSISLSHEIVAELWEYQRCVTTCANALVQPLMDRYLQRFERELAGRGFHGTLRLIHSAGGLVAPETARALPIRLLESGPAGGALATALFGELAGKKDVISFDMGGTTAKTTLIENGRAEIAPMMEAARVNRFKKGSGLPIKAPAIDMIEIGAGGGSIASIDEVGLLRVGPQSAGSYPGPACYGHGGTEPTVTDANLVLGYYDPGFFLGGRMTLDLNAARAAIAKVAQPLGLSIEEAASGIHKVVVESMAAAARVYLVEKGKDPRNYAMVGFGGAGPAHAAEIARTMGVGELIVPPASGAASALGFLAAPLSMDLVRSHPIDFSGNFEPTGINAVLFELEAQGRTHLRDAGVAENDITVERAADMRLIGQMHNISVPLPRGRIEIGHLAQIHDAFNRVYTTRYTAPPAGARFEAINLRVRCAGPSPQLALTGAAGGGNAGAKLKGTRKAWFHGHFIDTPIYDRYALRTGDRFAGPAIIEEREATILVLPGDTVRIDESLNICITISLAPPVAALIKPDTPVADAIKMIDADPIALEIMWSRLVTVVEEMWLTVCRTAFSLVISEAQDFACEVLDPDGETLAHSPRAMPVFNYTLPRAVKALLERFPAETLRPGDVLITNDPWLCSGHLFDVAIVTPCFRDGHLVGLLGTIGHVSDIGGTKDSLRAREIYEEGLQIPPMKFYRAGEPNEDLIGLISQNVRNPHQVMGDLQSLVVANALGVERLLAFMSDYGMHDLRALAAVVQGRSEQAMRDAISALPNGTYRSEIWNNPLGTPMRYPLRLTVRDDEIEVDFDGAPAQLPFGGINSTYNYTASQATYPLKCMLTPNVRGNAGCYRAFVVKAPTGSILNAERPASVSIRNRTGWYIAPNIFRALEQAAPQLVQAFTGYPLCADIYGQTADGRFYSDVLFTGGGQGASAHGDGKSGLIWPTSAANTSVELLEMRAPVLVVEKNYLPDSGGAGRHRGGLGQRMCLRKLVDDGRPLFISVYPESVGNPARGLFGGASGSTARGAVLDGSGRTLRDCGTGQLVSLTLAEEVVEIILGGGSGYGDPKDRNLDDLRDDIANGRVTPEGAKRDYGVDHFHNQIDVENAPNRHVA